MEEKSRKNKEEILRLINQLQKEVTCPICLDLFSNPVSLSECHHTFCKNCFTDLIKTSSKPNCVDCPLCKKAINRRNFEEDSKIPEIIKLVQKYQIILLKQPIAKFETPKRGRTQKTPKSSAKKRKSAKKVTDTDYPTLSIEKTTNLKKAKSLGCLRENVSKQPKSKRYSLGNLNKEIDSEQLSELFSSQNIRYLCKNDRQVIELMEEDCLANLEQAFCQNTKTEPGSSKLKSKSETPNDKGWNRMKSTRKSLDKNEKKLKQLEISTFSTKSPKSATKVAARSVEKKILRNSPRLGSESKKSRCNSPIPGPNTKKPKCDSPTPILEKPVSRKSNLGTKKSKNSTEFDSSDSMPHREITTRSKNSPKLDSNLETKKSTKCNSPIPGFDKDRKQPKCDSSTSMVEKNPKCSSTSSKLVTNQLKSDRNISTSSSDSGNLSPLPKSFKLDQFENYLQENLVPIVQLEQFEVEISQKKELRSTRKSSRTNVSPISEIMTKTNTPTKRETRQVKIENLGSLDSPRTLRKSVSEKKTSENSVSISDQMVESKEEPQNGTKDPKNAQSSPKSSHFEVEISKTLLNEKSLFLENNLGALQSDNLGLGGSQKENEPQNEQYISSLGQNVQKGSQKKPITTKSLGIRRTAKKIGKTFSQIVRDMQEEFGMVQKNSKNAKNDENLDKIESIGEQNNSKNDYLGPNEGPYAQNQGPKVQNEGRKGENLSPKNQNDRRDQNQSPKGQNEGPKGQNKGPKDQNESLKSENLGPKNQNDRRDQNQNPKGQNEGPKGQNKGPKDQNESLKSQNLGPKNQNDRRDQNQNPKGQNEGPKGQNKGPKGQNEGSEGQNEGLKGLNLGPKNRNDTIKAQIKVPKGQTLSPKDQNESLKGQNLGPKNLNDIRNQNQGPKGQTLDPKGQNELKVQNHVPNNENQDSKCQNRDPNDQNQGPKDLKCQNEGLKVQNYVPNDQNFDQKYQSLGLTNQNHVPKGQNLDPKGRNGQNNVPRGQNHVTIEPEGTHHKNLPPDDDIFEVPTQILNTDAAQNEVQNHVETVEQQEEIFDICTQKLSEPIEFDTEEKIVGNKSIPRFRLPFCDSQKSSEEGLSQNNQIVVQAEVHYVDKNSQNLSQNGKNCFDDRMDIEETNSTENIIVPNDTNQQKIAITKCLVTLDLIQNDILSKNNMVKEFSQFLCTSKSLFSPIESQDNKIQHEKNIAQNSDRALSISEKLVRSCPTLSTDKEVIEFYNTAIPHLNKLRELYQNYENIFTDITKQTKELTEIFGQNSSPLNALLSCERPEIGTKMPQKGSEWPDKGSERPKICIESTKFGLERSQIGSDGPQLGSKMPQDYEGSQKSSGGLQFGLERSQTGSDGFQLRSKMPQDYQGPQKSSEGRQFGLERTQIGLDGPQLGSKLPQDYQGPQKSSEGPQFGSERTQIGSDGPRLDSKMPQDFEGPQRILKTPQIGSEWHQIGSNGPQNDPKIENITPKCDVSLQTDFKLLCSKCQNQIIENPPKREVKVKENPFLKNPEPKIIEKKINRQLNFEPKNSEKKFKRIRNQSDSDSESDFKKKVVKRDQNPFSNNDLNIIFLSEQDEPNFENRQNPKTQCKDFGSKQIQNGGPRDTQDFTEKYKNILEREYKDLKPKTPENNNSFENIALGSEMNLPFEVTERQKESQFSKSLFTETDNFNKTILYNSYKPLEVHKINSQLENEFNNSFGTQKNSNREKTQPFSENTTQKGLETQFTKSLFTETNFEHERINGSKKGGSPELSMFTEKPNFHSTELDNTIIDPHKVPPISPKDIFDENDELDKEVASHLSNSFVEDSLDGCSEDENVFDDKIDVIDGTPDKTPGKNRRKNTSRENLEEFLIELDNHNNGKNQQELDLQNTEWLHNIAPPPGFGDSEKPAVGSFEGINDNFKTPSPEIFTNVNTENTRRDILNERVNLLDITQSLSDPNSQKTSLETSKSIKNQSLDPIKMMKSLENKTLELRYDKIEQENGENFSGNVKNLSGNGKSVCNLDNGQKKTNEDEILLVKDVDPLSLIQNEQNLALTLVKSKNYIPKTISTTPKQTSIFNFIKPSAVLSPRSPKTLSNSKIGLKDCLSPKNVDQFLNEPMDITPIKLKSKKEICLACTRLKAEDSQKLLSMTEKFKLSFSKNFTSKVTHLIVTVDDRNRIKDLTMKYVSAIANGIWIVSFLWILECLKFDRILPEEQYEVLDISGLPGPQKSRLTRKTKPLFKDFVFYCSEPFESVTKTDLENVLTNLGAEVVSNLAALKKKGKISLVLTEFRSSQDFEIYQNWFDSMNIISVEIEWLSRSVGQYEVTSVRPFMLCEDHGQPNNDYPPYLLAVVPESLTECTDAFTERP